MISLLIKLLIPLAIDGIADVSIKLTISRCRGLTHARRRRVDMCALLAGAASLVMALSGCVSVADQVAADIDKGRGICRQQSFRTNVEKARCHNAAEARLGEVWGPDLAAVRWQSRLVIAERTDRKQLTEAEAELEFARVNAELTSQALHRRDSQQLVEAQYEAALAQRRSRAMLQVQPPAPGGFECVSRTDVGQTRTQCRDTDVHYTRNNAAIQFQ